MINKISLLLLSAVLPGVIFSAAGAETQLSDRTIKRNVPKKKLLHRISSELQAIRDEGEKRRSELGAAAKADPRLSLKYVHFDAYMLGITSDERKAELAKLVKRVPVIGLVSYSGINPELIKSEAVEYVAGGKKSAGNHDSFQISEVLQNCANLGFAVRIKVYRAENAAQIAQYFLEAGKECDIVVTYYSFWNATQPMVEAVAANTQTLYLSPYVEVGQRSTNLSFQSSARHPDGSGLPNFATTIPLSANSDGKLFTPSARSEHDTETVTFVAPSAYASSPGETCPSSGVSAVVAAYILACSEPGGMTPDEVVNLMTSTAAVPEAEMLNLKNFTSRSVADLKDHLAKLTAPDALGIRRLESKGVLNLWNIYLALAEREAANRTLP